MGKCNISICNYSFVVSFNLNLILFDCSWIFFCLCQTVNELAGGNHRSGVMMWPGSNFPYGANKTLPSQVVPWNESYPWEWRVDVYIQ